MNYIIEDNINFFSELKKELNDSSNKETKSEKNEDICLITHQPLSENYITLALQALF